MSSSSPASIKSQTYEYVRVLTPASSTQMSDEGFKSQVPFQTQQPLRRHDPLTPRRAQRSASSPGSDVDSTEEGSKEDFSAHANQSSEQEIARSAVTNSPRDVAQSSGYAVEGKRLGERNPVPTCEAQREAEYEPMSSCASIECEPLDHGPTNSTILPSQTQTLRPDFTPTIDQPFPLVEWIRRIRTETRTEWPTSVLKWSRSIPKRQRAILDTDDAWYPPLPGRSARQGTVPIDLLTKLTQRVDEEAQKNISDEQATQDQEDDNVSEQHSVEQEHQIAHCEPPSSSPTIAEPWSSSPPSAERRRPLPPDTSPVLPPQNFRQRLASATAKHLENSKEVHVVGSTNSRSTHPTIRHHSPTESSNEQEQEHQPFPHAVFEEEKRDDSSVDCSPSTSRPKETLVLCVDAKLPPTKPPDETTSLSRPHSRIQVKDTPYPLKEMHRDYGSVQRSEDIPQSSLIAGTYPEVSLRQSKRNSVDACAAVNSQPILAQPATTPTKEKSTVASFRTPRSLLNRTTETVQREGHSDSNISRPPSRSQSRHSGKSFEPITEERTNKSKTMPDQGLVHGEPPSGNTLSSSPVEDPVTRLATFMERRKADSRAWREANSRSIIRDGVKYRPTPINPQVEATTVKVASSTPDSRGCGRAGANSASSPSIHHSGRRKAPQYDGASCETSTANSVENETCRSLFTSFLTTYPHYSGNLETFKSALQLLVSLKSAPYEPHPSLWDDFVYRMADDYVVYLKACIDRHTSAKPYQQYYYSNVKNPEHRQGILAEEHLRTVIDQLIGRHNSSPSLHGTTLSSPEDAADASIEDVSMSPPRHAQSRVAPSSSQPRRQMQNKSLRRSLPGASTPIPQKRDETHTKQVDRSSMSDGTVKKRQSLPWGDRSSRLGTPIPIYRPSEAVVDSGKKSSVAATVEQWLDRPAGASSPELEPTSIPAGVKRKSDVLMPDSNTVQSSTKRAVSAKRVQNLDVGTLRLPNYLVNVQEDAGSSVGKGSVTLQRSIASSDVASQAERPVTPFTLFARNFAQLRSERALNAVTEGRKKLPINVYNW